MAVHNTSKSDETRQIIRKATVVSAACGLFINTISIIFLALKSRGKPSVIVCGLAFLPLTLSIFWSFVGIGRSSALSKNAFTALFTTVIDLFLFTLYLSLAIMNGVVTSHYSGWDLITSDKMMLIAYNSVPWLFCAGTHLLLVLHFMATSLRISTSPRAHATCPDCQRNWDRREAAQTSGDEASRPLFAAHHDDDESV